MVAASALLKNGWKIDQVYDTLDVREGSEERSHHGITEMKVAA